MINFKDIEFWDNRQGGLMMCENLKTGEIQPYLLEFVEMTDFMYNKIEEDYPEAFKSLCNSWKHHANFHYMVVLNFLKCNFRENDKFTDIDDEGNLNVEDVHCPLKYRGLLCKDQGIVCNPKLNTILTNREKEYIPHLISGMTSVEIADTMYVSHFTVEFTRKKIYTKLGFSGKNAIAQLATWAYKNGIIKSS